MNKEQKEVLQSQLNDEKAVLNNLKKEYEEALKNVDEKIKVFQSDIQAKQDALSLMVDENQKALLQSEIQSKIYQKQYQQALKKQISAIYDNMNSNQYDTIKDYINGSYESGYLGTMYDLQEQGIPLISPIDQTQVIQATINDTKLSKPLYEALGYDVNQLKKQINSEISRGIAASLSFDDISRNIKNYSNMALNKAFRIARTEGHRVQNQAAYNAQKKAIEAGADIVKQWDAALDKRTRPSHARVDGQIKEFNEPFDNGLMFPGDPKGSAGEVINCRCALLQRAKWALDDDELAILKKRAEYYGLAKTESFEEYKEKYIAAVQNTIKKQDYSEISFEEYQKLASEAEYNKNLRYDEVSEKIIGEGAKIDFSSEEAFNKSHMIKESQEAVYSVYTQTKNSYAINEYLRNHGDTLGNNILDQQIEQLNRVFSSFEMPKKTIVTRFADKNYMESVFGGETKDDVLKSIGSVIEEKQFLSTSADIANNAFTDRMCKLIMQVDEGTHCFPTLNFAESEIIFPRNTAYEILGATESSTGQIEIIVHVIKK